MGAALSGAANGRSSGAGRLRAGHWPHRLATLLIVVVAVMTVPRVLSWAIVHGVWRGDGAACREDGACWAFLGAKLPFILFGIYPEAERWRPIIVVAMLLALVLWSLPRAHWTARTVAAWGAGLVMSFVLLAGGVGGLTPVATAAWGGLPITLLLTILSLAIGFPLGIGLALARRSRLPAFRWVATAIVEVLRGLPLLAILFVASVMSSLILPPPVTLDLLGRALAALSLTSAAYLSEVIRGGLQGVGDGQEEAAIALGMQRRDVLLWVVLPQAIRNVLPALTSTIVTVIKNTSLVLVIGLFDLLSSGRVALSDPAWPTPYAETYLFIALIYFALCFGVSRYARHLERVPGHLR